MKISTWILTFNRPVVLNRLIRNLNTEGIHPNVFSNHPILHIDEGLTVDRTVINTLNNVKSNSWCARSWNSIFIKAFLEAGDDGVICIQDDTNVKPGFLESFMEAANKYDFISGPAGDQFFYLTRDVVKKIGWFDERYIGCYCGDADYFKRVFLGYDKDKVSQTDSHSWGWQHNPSSLIGFIDTELGSKTCQPSYENQHWALDKLGKVNRTLLAAQAHYKAKWGMDLDNNGPMNTKAVDQLLPEIDWYPSMSAKLGYI